MHLNLPRSIIGFKLSNSKPGRREAAVHLFVLIVDSLFSSYAGNPWDINRCWLGHRTRDREWHVFGWYQTDFISVPDFSVSSIEWNRSHPRLCILSLLSNIFQIFMPEHIYDMIPILDDFFQAGGYVAPFASLGVLLLATVTFLYFAIPPADRELSKISLLWSPTKSCNYVHFHCSQSGLPGDRATTWRVLGSRRGASSVPRRPSWPASRLLPTPWASLTSYPYLASTLLKWESKPFILIKWWFLAHQADTVPSKSLTLDLIFKRDWDHQNASYRKMKRIKVVENFQIYKFGSVYYWYMIHPNKVRNLAKKKSKVSMRSKVRSIYGT
jgi:hypothetical protein